MQIRFTYEGEQYTLEYTRDSVCKMEDKGFDIGSYDDKKVTFIRQLVSGAFIAHHSELSLAEIDKIYDSLDNKEELLKKLAEMYAEPVNSLVEPGNVKWEEN